MKQSEEIKSQNTTKEYTYKVYNWTLQDHSSLVLLHKYVYGEGNEICMGIDLFLVLWIQFIQNLYKEHAERESKGQVSSNLPFEISDYKIKENGELKALNIALNSRDGFGSKLKALHPLCAHYVQHHYTFGYFVKQILEDKIIMTYLPHFCDWMNSIEARAYVDSEYAATVKYQQKVTKVKKKRQTRKGAANTRAFKTDNNEKKLLDAMKNTDKEDSEYIEDSEEEKKATNEMMLDQAEGLLMNDAGVVGTIDRQSVVAHRKMLVNHLIDNNLLEDVAIDKKAWKAHVKKTKNSAEMKAILGKFGTPTMEQLEKVRETRNRKRKQSHEIATKIDLKKQKQNNKDRNNATKEARGHAQNQAAKFETVEDSNPVDTNENMQPNEHEKRSAAPFTKEQEVEIRLNQNAYDQGKCSSNSEGKETQGNGMCLGLLLSHGGPQYSGK